MNILYEQLSKESIGSITHTRLYHLLPLGAGTPMIESLTGYISRLAAAHAISAGALLTEELLPRIPKGAPVGVTVPKSTDARQLCLNGPHTINGVTERAEHWVRLLQALTGINDLRSLTMLALTGICSSQNLLRKHRSWCPLCFDEQWQASKDTSEPLLWAVQAVVVCPVHKCSLITVCPHCQRTQHILAGRSRPGHCCRCGRLLTLGRRPERVLDDSPVAHQHLWVAENMGALLAACSATQIGMMRVCLQNNLKNCVADLADGNRSQIVRATEIKERTLDAWLSGTFLPELPNLLTFCYKLRIPVLRFLAETPREADEDWEQARKIASEYASRRKRRRRADVRQTLGQAASLTEIAAEFDYQSIDSLRHHDSDACSTLFRREPRPEMKRAIGPVEREELNRKISNRLEAALKMHPPRSVRSLAIELGFSDSTSLRCRFPDLCNCLVTAAVRFREERRAQIAACLEAALLENPPPTLKAFAKRLPRKDIQSLRLWFPGLCRQLIDRWQENRAMRIRTAGTALEAARRQKHRNRGNTSPRELVSRRLLWQPCSRRLGAT